MSFQDCQVENEKSDHRAMSDKRERESDKLRRGEKGWKVESDESGVSSQELQVKEWRVNGKGSVWQVKSEKCNKSRAKNQNWKFISN